MSDSRVTETAAQPDHPDNDLPVVKFSRRTGLSDEGWFYTYCYSTLDEIAAVLTRRDVERCTPPLASLCLHAITQKTGISSLHLRQFVMGILIPTDFYRRVLQETWIGRLLPPPTHFPESLLLGKRDAFGQHKTCELYGITACTGGVPPIWWFQGIIFSPTVTVNAESLHGFLSPLLLKMGIFAFSIPMRIKSHVFLTMPS